MAMKRVGYLESCSTEYCGGVEGYFCVVCNHYLADCRCTPGNCACLDDIGWASTGERKYIMGRVIENMYGLASSEEGLRLRTVLLLPRDTARQRVDAREQFYALCCSLHRVEVKEE